jgi:beta-1,4-mannosyl-glycoprotein beta-1,4-N-acetylglucosaminyltransferase
MLIIDAFLFYNELDILFYRLRSLYNHVDYFILVESKYTFAGTEKELFYDQSKERFQEYHSKIVHIILEELPYRYPNIDYSKNQQWINEHFQRNSIKKGIDQLRLLEEDIILVSDVDEIPDRDVLSLIKENSLIIDTIYSLDQDFYYYNLNTKNSKNWNHAKILSYKIYKLFNMLCQLIREHYLCHLIRKGGWHLSYFGDKEFIQNKIETFSHQEYNNPLYNTLEKIQDKIENQRDLYNRCDETLLKIPIQQNDYLPHQYEELLSQYIVNE